MWDWIIFLRNQIVNVTDILNSYTFSFSGMSVSILDLLIGFILMGMVLSIFWKGARA